MAPTATWIQLPSMGFDRDLVCSCVITHLEKNMITGQIWLKNIIKSKLKLFRDFYSTPTTSTTSTMTSDPQACGPAPPIAIYSDTTTGFTACQAHAKANGYAFKQQDNRPFRALFVCDRAGKYDPRGKTKKYFPGPIKSLTGNWERHPTFQAFLSSWNILLASTTEEAFDANLLEFRSQFSAGATSYCESTWLLWKEKLVAFWVDQLYHFGVTVTSPIEGCHATLKLYLQRGHADLRGVFLKLQLFWTAQHSGISSAIVKQQLRPRHSTNIPLLAAILPYVHTRALQKIVQEASKLPASGPLPNSCFCTTQQAFGLPCFHTLWKRQQEGGSILLSDIHHN
ncbi:uncharacterized protein RSE6_08066 [Rhynchosporium secalis]|uniref:SWIM-type domain-containing protein n=1 Tax=Rhynchosporium secalis TaxID=38038 RepID=A0A1E1MEN3_RHYSE|nr:uncharacterized protein RSE6_08066 [Rhynchosporium secalis]